MPQPILVAILGDGWPRHVLHHEVGVVLVGHARVEYPRDVGVIHERERLLLRLETG